MGLGKHKVRWVSIAAWASGLLISATHNGNIYASMPPQAITIEKITPRQTNYWPYGPIEPLEMTVIQGGRKQTYAFIGGTSLGIPGRELPHEIWAEQDILIGFASMTTKAIA
jgi:hypothetical protein